MIHCFFRSLSPFYGLNYPYISLTLTTRVISRRKHSLPRISFDMSTKLQQSSDPIDQYITEHSLRLTPEQKEIIEYTKNLPGNYLLYSIIEKKQIS
jgi:hypothetical protein